MPVYSLACSGPKHWNKLPDYPIGTFSWDLQKQSQALHIFLPFNKLVTSSSYINVCIVLYVMHTYYGSEYHLLIYCQLSISFIVHCLLQRYYILYIRYSIQYTGYMPYASCCVKQAIIIIIV